MISLINKRQEHTHKRNEKKDEKRKTCTILMNVMETFFYNLQNNKRNFSITQIVDKDNVIRCNTSSFFP